MNRALHSSLNFWGKTARDTPCPRGGTTSIAFKPVLHHLLDVAATALCLQLANPSRLAREAALLGVEPKAHAHLTAFLAGLHDLGKFNRDFQAKRPDLWPTGVLGPLASSAPLPHWRATAILLRAAPVAPAFELLFPSLDADGLTSVIAAVAGHHGRPPDSEELTCRANIAASHPALLTECVEAAVTAFASLKQQIMPQPVQGLSDVELVALWSWRLSGLITLADWVGSDDAYFVFDAIDIPLERYWPAALSRAEQALRDKGLTPQAIFPTPDMTRLAPAVTMPRPMQRLAEAVALKEGPQLFILEDTTGSGKTEAALVLASRLMAAGKGEGLYIALPTMATANAMYGRLAGQKGGEEPYRRLFADGTEPSLVLAHGKATLMKELVAATADKAEGEESVAAFCTAWIADNRRKAFFADVGAGTIDQAFLGILPKKHLTLRQYALAGRILLVDEAHSFDAYMGEELTALIRQHTAHGGSTIILSATLAHRQKQDIAKAFGEGLRLRDPDVLGEAMQSHAYPLLTAIAADGAIEVECAFAHDLRRRVAAERAETRTAALEDARRAAAQGAAVLIVCNAVDEAIGVHVELADAMEPDKLHLFHARFAQGDRQAIEQDVLARFGRDAPMDRRAGHMLVATQVVEQSLDLDFDLVISDLAPVDLIIQRAGRLWRHMDRRPRHRRPIDGPRLIIVAPDPAEAKTVNWLEPALGKAAFVYQHAGVMWRSARVLFEAGEIVTPESFRPMIETVYAGDGVPVVLQAAQQRGEGQGFGARSLARRNVIDTVAGYGGLPTSLSADEQIGTRLGEKTITLRLARMEEGGIVPWVRQQGLATDIAWALSEISVREKWLGKVASPAADLLLHEAAKAAWPEWEQPIMIAVVADDGVVRLEGAASFTYSPTHGLKRNAVE